jgi:hypothetical protein
MVGRRRLLAGVLAASGLFWGMQANAYELDNLALFDIGVRLPPGAFYTEVRCAALFANSALMAEMDPAREAEAVESNSKLDRFWKLVLVHPLNQNQMAVNKRFEELKNYYYEKWEAHSGKDGSFFDQMTVTDFKVCNHILREKYIELYRHGHTLGDDGP